MLGDSKNSLETHQTMTKYLDYSAFDLKVNKHKQIEFNLYSCYRNIKQVQ